MRGMRIGALAFGTLMAGMMLPANAATITELVTFSANTFQATGGTPPQDPVMGSFKITFDPTVTYPDNTTAGITLESLNISLGSALSFFYSPVSQTVDGQPYNPGELVVGGTFDDTGSVQYSPATDDFWLQIDDFSSTPAFVQVGYAQVSAGNNLFYTINNTGSVSVTPVSATPLPAALPLLATGLGALGLLGWRRKRKATPAIAA